jgi:glycosyltransferase involved in cell wall biosynthesis
MRISVIICTYGRAAVLRDLLDSLEAQTHQNFEILIIDGNEEPSPARSTVYAFQQRPGTSLAINLIGSERGLAHQRNVGLDCATGELICFLDDDVTLPDDFLFRVANIFEQHEMHDVSGITGYDEQNYSAPVTLRWRLRRALGVIPDLTPGGVDHLGRGIPLSFLQPFTGYKEVGLLPGFCMIFRKCSLGNLRFDELIPTYAGEDRDFSMQVGWRHRMLVCGDLRLRHHATPQGRDSDLKRNFQSAFGMGRRFAKYSRGGLDDLRMVGTFLGDLVIDLIFLLTHPTRANLLTTVTRIRGFFTGLRSDTAAIRQMRFSMKVDSTIDSSDPQRERISSTR